jgi:predicted GNAT family acetyltransferase
VYDRVVTDSPEVRVTDNREARRFEVAIEGHVAFLQYERKGTAMVLVHTEVPDALRGRGLADALAKTALASAHAEGLTIIAECPFVRTYMRRHPNR